MQTQQISPYAGEQPGYGGMKQEHTALPEADDHTHKKSVLGKVKEKAKKLKTKIKKPKSSGSGENDDTSTSSNSEDDEPHDQQQRGDQLGDETEVVATPGPTGEAYEAYPDIRRTTNVNTREPNVEEHFGQLNIRGDDEPELETGKFQEEIASAPGHVSQGATPYHLATHDIRESQFSPEAQPVELGKDTIGRDPLTPQTDFQGSAPLHSDNHDDTTQTSDNAAAWYTPTSKDDTGGQRSMLEQAKEKIFCSSTQRSAGETGESKPITSRATETMSGLKDSFASKFGYGDVKSPASEGSLQDESVATETGAQKPDNNKPILEKLQEKVAGATSVVTSKLVYGDAQQHATTGEDIGASDTKPAQSDTKSYSQKAYDAAQSAREVVASKLGYDQQHVTTGEDVGASDSRPAQSDTNSSTEMLPSEGEQKSYLQKMQETDVGVKDAVATKLGYDSGKVPALSEGAYGHQNVPTSTTARFHPGEEDQALSQLITEKMSTGASTMKDTLLKPFASKSGPITTPPPLSAADVAANPVHTTVQGGDPPTPQVKEEDQPSIIGKVTGAVSSLLGSSVSGKKYPDEFAGKAKEDPQAQAADVCDLEMH